jgi:methyltransferase (TIGR00027 family)
MFQAMICRDKRRVLIMSKKGVEKRHSETAIFGALYRAVANKEFKDERIGSDYLAEYLLPPHFRFLVKFRKIRTNVKRKSDRFTPGMYEYMIARTVFFDNAFTEALNNNVRQIVLLGAGYDTRAYRFREVSQTTKILELDIVTTQNRKKKCLKKARIPIPKHVTLVPINFNEDSLETVLETAGYENHVKTLFIWEGVSYYLEPESVDATLEFFTKSSNHESIIAFDYAISISEENLNNYYGVKEFSQTWRKYRSNEPFRFCIDEGEIESFLAQRGLHIVNHLNNVEIGKRFLLNKDMSSLGPINGSFRFAMASPNNS